ncbi:alpha/beta hydrolase [Acinetobacter puyangensis]|uniref:Secretory lipase n=1 Tax=Acinetobacter puyangensis TaxID=1096779 RepID=A0A240EAZ1_9GAMM|nr:lipase family protein [Acinetobacter puyangensis]SNX45706.1 Secretory lipase [Acinetobacter puyangensis]
MLKFNQFCLSLLGASMTLTSIAAQPVIHYQSSPLYGDQKLSAFYQWDQKIPDKAGTLLRFEPLDQGIRLADSADQYRILFSSTNGIDSRSPTVVSGSLFLPKGKAPEGGWPLLVWGHGTVGLADQCAPSWSGRVYRNAYYLNQWLKQGYAVVEPDYQGLGVAGPHLLINVPQLSYNILDSARAVVGRQFNVANQVIIAGQSQGGAAAFGAASYSASYAPDINVKGTIATGVIYRKPNSERPVLNAVNKYQPNPALAYQILGFHVLQQYDLSIQASDVFTEKAIPLVEHSRSQCVGQIFSDVSFEKLSIADALLDKPSDKYLALQKLFEEKYSYYPTLKINHPVFIGTGADDRTPDARTQVELVKDACEAGTQVESHVYHGHGHSEAVPHSLNDALTFANKVIHNQPIQNTCSVKFE